LWADPTKDVSGQKDKYKFPLPWIPMRKRSTEGSFYTQIPEDISKTLVNYLEYARIDVMNVDAIFQNSVQKLDEKVHVSFAGN
jgi:hypothetical protein